MYAFNTALEDLPNSNHSIVNGAKTVTEPYRMSTGLGSKYTRIYRLPLITVSCVKQDNTNGFQKSFITSEVYFSVI